MSKLTGNQEFNGEVYVYGLGGYNGTNPSQSESLKDVVDNLAKDIRESKPDQEFVYRKSPNTINAESMTLDGINGKTLAWNQVIDLANMSGYMTISISGTQITGTSIDGDNNNLSIACFELDNHIYYFAFSYISNIDYAVQTMDTALATPASSAFVRKSYCGTRRTSGYSGFYWYNYSPMGAGDWVLVLKDIICVDLTLLYGSAIDGMTDAEILAKFESEFPGYHANNPGALISNDAESLETVGFNKWDEEWEVGRYSYSGVKIADSTRIRCKNKVKVFAGRKYFVQAPFMSGADFNFLVFDANGNLISSSIQFITSAQEITMPSGADSIVFYIGPTYGTTYNHDICINISDPSRNGQYEPYKKSVCPLNLNKIRVISPNIWDEEWADGIIQPGTGEFLPGGGVVCSPNYIKVIPGGRYYFHSPSGSNIVFSCYNDQKEFLSTINTVTVGRDVTLAADCYYIRFYLQEYDVHYNHDICINISNPAFNGRYFPYGTLELEGGVKGTGSVYDEIRDGREYRKRMKRIAMDTIIWTGMGGGVFYSDVIPDLKALSYCVCSEYSCGTPGNSSDAEAGPDKTIRVGVDNRFYVKNTDGVPSTSGALDYELQYEEVYDLAEPLPTSMPAGTTEARISPNADGLSAPFCCDITYRTLSVNYSETAGVSIHSKNSSMLDGHSASEFATVEYVDEKLGNINSVLATI